MIGGRAVPYRNGVERVSFVVRIPCSVLNRGAPVNHIVQYGHGTYDIYIDILHAFILNSTV